MKGMIIMKKTIATLIALLSLAAPAAAARPLLTQAQADREAKDSLEFSVSYSPEYVEQGEAYAVSYELDPCEVGRRRAECDFSMTFTDGDVCDGTITVWRTRRGRITSQQSTDVCDSEG